LHRNPEEKPNTRCLIGGGKRKAFPAVSRKKGEHAQGAPNEEEGGKRPPGPGRKVQADIGEEASPFPTCFGKKGTSHAQTVIDNQKDERKMHLSDRENQKPRPPPTNPFPKEGGKKRKQHGKSGEKETGMSSSLTRGKPSHLKRYHGLLPFAHLKKKKSTKLRTLSRHRGAQVIRWTRFESDLPHLRKEARPSHHKKKKPSYRKKPGYGYRIASSYLREKKRRSCSRSAPRGKLRKGKKSDLSDKRLRS